MLRRLLAWAAARWLPSRPGRCTSVARAHQMIAQGLEAFETLNNRARPRGKPHQADYFSFAAQVAEGWGKYTGMSDPCVRYGAAHTLRIIRDYQRRGETTLLLRSVHDFLPNKHTKDQARIDRQDEVQDPLCFDVCMIVWRTIDEEYSDNPAYLFLHDCSSDHWHQVMAVVLDLVDLILARRLVRTVERMKNIPPDGTRVETRSKVHGLDRYPHFIAPTHCTGTVKWWGETALDGIEVKVDQHIDGCEEWENAISYPEFGHDVPMFWDDWKLLEEEPDLVRRRATEGSCS